MTGKRSNIGVNRDVGDFDALFREFFVPLTWYARKYTGDVDSAKEIVHNVFVNTWEKRESLDLETTVKSYLYTAVHNRCLNFLRDRSKFVPGNVADLGYLSQMADDDNHGIESSETESIIYQAIDNLPDRCREVFKLNRFEGKKYSEIAGILEISVKTVEGQMSKAIRVLREKLKDCLFIIVLWITTNLF